MAGKPVTPEVRLFSARVRAGDKRALQRVSTTLQRHGGNMQATAAELGVAVRTLYLWAEESPDVERLVAEHARGRVGRPPVKA